MSTTYEKTEATITNAISTIAASRPVNASSALLLFFIVQHIAGAMNYLNLDKEIFIIDI